MILIQSAQNPAFRHALKLATQRRERLKTSETLLDGPHLLASWLDAGREVLQVFVTGQGAENPEIAALLARCAGPKVLLDDKLFAELTELPSHSGVLARVAIPQAAMVRDAGFCVLLDGVQDPGNVGSILRTAVAAGVDQVLLSNACADVWSPKVLRAGMGAHAALEIIERADLTEFARGFKGKIAATLLEGSESLYATDLRGSLALVLGSEGAGVSADLAKLATTRIRIPMAPGIESLNVAAAAAICLFERVRQVS
jgi:TrmH family RNA methyltransferase